MVVRVPARKSEDLPRGRQSLRLSLSARYAAVCTGEGFDERKYKDKKALASEYAELVKAGMERSARERAKRAGKAGAEKPEDAGRAGAARSAAR